MLGNLREKNTLDSLTHFREIILFGFFILVSFYLNNQTLLTSLLSLKKLSNSRFIAQNNYSIVIYLLSLFWKIHDPETHIKTHPITLEYKQVKPPSTNAFT